MYNNCPAYDEELEDVFSHSEILYLIQHENNTLNNDSDSKPKKYMDMMDIINIIKELIDEYDEKESIDRNNLREICLNLWFYCMGWTEYKKENDLLQLIDTNCNKLFIFMMDNYNINLLMMLLKMSLLQHKKSIDSLLEESQGIIIFNDVYSNNNNNKMKCFWETFEILNICMNSILCIAWSQRNNGEIINNALFISSFHIDGDPLFIHLFNYIAQENYCERMPIKKFIIYIRWHLFFSDKTGNKLNEIINILANKSKYKNKKKCKAFDFFQIANEIDCNYAPLLILPPSIKQQTSSISPSVLTSGFNKISNASSILKNSISEIFGNDEEKYNANREKQIKYQRPTYLDYKYPIYRLPINLQFEAGNPRIQLFGKDIIPKQILNLFQNCYQNLPNRSIKKYNIYACDIYKYIAIKSRIPDSILIEQENNKQFSNLENKKDSSPKWLQNIRMGLGIKMLIKLLCSSMPSSYSLDKNMRIPNVPDIRYEIVTLINGNKEKLNYFMELRRHQNILTFNILNILLGLLKLFKTHEILQFEYLKYLLQKNNAIIVLCKVFNHPWSVRDHHYNLYITKPQTFINYNKQQLIDKIYNDNDNDNDHQLIDAISSSQINTIKINSLRIIAKCIKYSYGHCCFLVNVLKAHKWMIKYINNNDDIMRYYILKIYKSMMPFLNEEWRKQKDSQQIIELINNNIRIGINDQWLSYSISIEFDEAIKKYKEEQDKPQNLQFDGYYHWLALKKPTEKDYAETCLNPFYITNNYGIPRLHIIAPKQWTEIIDDACTAYHEWLFLQIKLDEKEFIKQKKYIGMTKKQMEKQKIIDRSNKIDQGLAKINIPTDFDLSAYLVAYFKGNSDEMLDKISNSL